MSDMSDYTRLGRAGRDHELQGGRTDATAPRGPTSWKSASGQRTVRRIGLSGSLLGQTLKPWIFVPMTTQPLEQFFVAHRGNL